MGIEYFSLNIFLGLRPLKIKGCVSHQKQNHKGEGKFFFKGGGWSTIVTKVKFDSIDALDDNFTILGYIN